MKLAEFNSSDPNNDVSISPKLKIFSLNTCQTGRRYGLFEKILDSINKENPDVVLLQEVFAGSLERIQQAIGGPVFFSQMCRMSVTDRESDAEGWGIAVGSRHNLIKIGEDFYRGTREQSKQVILNEGVFPTASLLQTSLEIGSERFNFATTHYPWVRGAAPSDTQLHAFKELLQLLKQAPDLVLTGDFNSPRGFPIFDSLAQIYQDNIPANVKSTLDTSVRPEAIWPYVIDGLFSSPHYLVKDVRMVQGLSDHKGSLSQIQRIST